MNRNQVLLLTLLLVLLVGIVSADWPGSVGAWDYRKEFTVNNAGSDLTDYQVMFTVNRSAGSDSGATVYLNGKCEEDYDDIRFTTSDGETPLDYWIESSSSTVASIWVELDSIPAGNTDFYIYYGNPGASAVSDGGATFLFFDDFSGSSLDAGKWTSSGSPSVSSSVVTITGTAWENIISKTTFATNTRFKQKASLLKDYYGFSGYAGSTPLSGAFIGYYLNNPTAGEINAETNNGSVSYQALGALSGYKLYEIVRNGSTNGKFYVNGSLVATLSTNLYKGTTSALMTAQSADCQILCDWIFISKYTETEPTISTWESEEEQFPASSVAADFSGLPLSGNVPLTVYFTDNSTGNNCTLNTWQWSFGDTSPNSTQQNPAHTYTTSGLYSVILTVTNTSFSKTNSLQRSNYVNATVNADAPTADFTVTETCGDVGDTFYFIDFSTGGGLYAWNWSFGDGTYSELRNPTHQYAGEDTYDVSLTVWGAYGTDSLTRNNLITIPCGAATPTPTPTPTPTGGTGNVTEGNITYIYAPDQDYVPFPIWLAIVVVSIAMFGHSIIFLRNSDLTAMMAAVFAFISAWLSNMIGYIDVQVTSFAEEIIISPVIQAVHPPWLVYTMLIFAFVSVVNIFAAIYKVYLKPRNWNEMYDRKTTIWQRRK